MDTKLISGIVQLGVCFFRHSKNQAKEPEQIKGQQKDFSMEILQKYEIFTIKT